MNRLNLTLLTALSLSGGCSSYNFGGSAKDSADEGTEEEADGDADADTDEGDEDTDVDSEPPEDESDDLALKPAQTDVFVFIVNPDRDTVTRVNVSTGKVDTTPVGHDPRKVATTPDWSKAVVFNRGDDSVTLLDATSLEGQVVSVRDNLNDMVLSPDGGWVALWHNVAAERPDDPKPDGLQSYNEVSFVNVTTGEHQAMAVGFNPRSIVYTSDDSLAVVVSDQFLALIDLTQAELSPELVDIATDPLDPAAAEEILLAPDGTWAFVRQFGTDTIAVVDLLNKTVERVPAGLNPTDMDLSPDKKQAVVLARGSRELYQFDANDPFAAPTVVATGIDLPLGQLQFAGGTDQGLLYTTASGLDRYATWDTTTDQIVLRALIKPVQTMAVTPDGKSALVFHTKTDAADADPQSPFQGAWAMTMIDLQSYITNPLKLPAEPIGYSNSSDGNLGFFIMDGERYLEVLDYKSLLYDQIDLPSDPAYVGVLPDLDDDDGDSPRAWASQIHNLGRITFYDPDDGAVDTITGFELNSLIED